MLVRHLSHQLDRIYWFILSEHKEAVSKISTIFIASLALRMDATVVLDVISLRATEDNFFYVERKLNKVRKQSSGQGNEPFYGLCRFLYRRVQYLRQFFTS